MRSRSLSAPPDISGDAGVSSSGAGAFSSRLRLHLALRLRVAGVTLRLHPRPDGDERARIDVCVGECGVDVRTSMGLGVGGRALSSELSAQLNEVRVVHWHQAPLTSGPEAAWECTNVLCCSDAAAAEAVGGRPAPSSFAVLALVHI